MKRKKKSNDDTPESMDAGTADKGKEKAGDGQASGEHEPVRTSGWTERKPKIHSRSFPGSRQGGAEQPMRLAFTKEAYAELLTHAKEHLDVEVCGVLVGEHCEDSHGFFVEVQGVIRGQAARQSGTHVTFTHDTWNAIHEQREQDYPKKEIVGWYHSHPGFGVEWSDMDLFIQKNFFTGFHQVAVVVDPVGGEEAACVSLAGDIEHLSAFWVDSRERRCTLPRRRPVEESRGAESLVAAASGSTPALEESVRALETRVYQLVQEVDAQRRSLGRFLFTAGLALCMCFVAVVAYAVYTLYAKTNLPPEKVHFSSVPVKVGDDTYLMGVQVVRWRLPDKLARQYHDDLAAQILMEQIRAQQYLQQYQQQYQQPLDQAWRGSLGQGTSPPAGQPLLQPQGPGQQPTPGRDEHGGNQP